MKKINIIFLDIDGVLNSLSGLYKRGGQSIMDIYVEHIEVLNWILRYTNARIVISSTWRKGRSVEQLKQLLYNYGIPSRYIIDKTPVIVKKEMEIKINGKTYTSVPRGLEIQKWLDDTEYEIEDFVIIDDDSDMAHLMDHLVQTKFDYGLTYVEGEKAIAKFRGERWFLDERDKNRSEG